MTVEIAEAVTDEDLAACFSLRFDVFCGEQGVTEAEERDGLDEQARHILARLSGVPAGTLRVRFVDSAVKIERVCVSKDARGTGLGALLTQAALDLARDVPGITRAKLGAQVQVIPFYEKLGFAVDGPEFLDAGIPHRMMERTLA